MNEYSPKTWLALEIFAVIFVLIMSSSSLPVVTNLPNSTALHAHWYFRRGFRFSRLWWYKLFINELRQYISRVFIFAFLILFAKFAKIKTSRKFLLIQYIKPILFSFIHLKSSQGWVAVALPCKTDTGVIS